MKKILLPIILVALFLLGACTKHTCPTYSDTQTDSTSMQAYIAHIHATDTVPYKPSNLEKTGAVLFGIFIIYATTAN